MQHRRKGRILKREKGQREALLKSLERAIVMKGNILTTEAKAKEVRPRLERLITRARKNTVASYRYVIAEIGKDAASRMKKDILPKLSGRQSGYLRIMKNGARKSDASRMAFIGFVDQI